MLWRMPADHHDQKDRRDAPRSVFLWMPHHRRPGFQPPRFLGARAPPQKPRKPPKLRKPPKPRNRTPTNRKSRNLGNLGPTAQIAGIAGMGSHLGPSISQVDVEMVGTMAG